MEVLSTGTSTKFVLIKFYLKQIKYSDQLVNNITCLFAENSTTNSCMTQPLMIKAGPYLFPFILEYSLVAMTTLIVVCGNINLRVTRELYRSICLALDKKRIDSTKCKQLAFKALGV